MAKAQERVAIELVTAHSKKEYDRVWHGIASRPDIFSTFGTWQHYGEEIKDNFHKVSFIFRVGESEPKAIGLAWLDRYHDRDAAHMGLALLPEFRGQGYGAICGRLVLRMAFETLGVHKVESNAFTSNPASIRIQKGGMRQEGVVRAATKVGGKYVDRVLFGLLREEWEEQVSSGHRVAP